MRTIDDLVVLRREGLYCPHGDFYIDPWQPVARAVITHGHGDHSRTGMGEYHTASPGLPILQWRLGDQRYHPHGYGEAFELGSARVSLHSAGHVLGSSQVRIEVDGRVWDRSAADAAWVDGASIAEATAGGAPPGDGLVRVTTG